ncbi:MAG: DUF305 domain-containing protein [Actinobacteria bacterium]|nr:DUF305 domain-containing protein [Actinomycetota bacterium]
MRKLIAVMLGGLALVAAGCGGGGGSGKSADGAKTTTSGEVPFDQAFVDAMVPHHRDAIEMAEAAKARGLTQPELVTVADDIVSSQQREIDQMLAWREQWFGSRALGPVLPEVLGVPESELGMEHGGADEITAADDVDATFAQMMIPHHEGAITMAKAAQRDAQHQEVKDLATAIIAAQKREIRIMNRYTVGMHHE